MAQKKKVESGKTTSVVNANDHKAFASQVQTWAVTDSEVILTFLRAEPEIPGGATGTRYDMNNERFFNEAVVYIPIAQALSMIDGIRQSITQRSGKGN